MGFLREYRIPLIGAAGLHAGLLLIAALASLQWVREQPPVQLAIEATVVDSSTLPQASKAAKATAKPAVKPAVDPPLPAQVQEKAEMERRAAEERASEQAARETQLQRERQASERQQREQAELQRQAEAAAKAKAAADPEAAKAQARAAADAKAAAEARKREEAVEVEKQRRDELLAREQAERAQGEREAELRRRLAAEEEEAEGGAAAQQGLIDEYRAALVQAIERNWIKPVTARTGLECVLLVDQAQGGTVLGVRIGHCNGDDAVRESIVTAVHRASPLPLPRDPRAFQRRLEIVFKPRE